MRPVQRSISERAAKGLVVSRKATAEAETRASAGTLSCLPRSGLIRFAMVVFGPLFPNFRGTARVPATAFEAAEREFYLRN